MEITKEEAINETFTGWLDAKNAIAGFVAWAWDERKSVLELLHGGDSAWMDQLADDIAYTVNQADEYRGEDFKAAAKEWLEYNRDDLISAMEAEIWEDALEKDLIPGWAIKAALEYLVEYDKIDVDSANAKGQTWLSRELKIDPSTVRKWISGARNCSGLSARAVRQVIEETL